MFLNFLSINQIGTLVMFTKNNNLRSLYMTLWIIISCLLSANAQNRNDYIYDIQIGQLPDSLNPGNK